MSRNLVLAVLASLVLTFGMALGQSRAPTFTQIDYPASGTTGTIVNSINARGDFVGIYFDAAGNTHGFLRKSRKGDNGDADATAKGIDLSGGQFTTIDYPTANPNAITNLNAINDEGDIAGTVQFNPALPGGDYHGFLLRDGVFENVEFPGHLNTIAAGVTDIGEVIGCYHDHDFSTTMHGMILSHGNYTALDGHYPPLPNESASMNNGATPHGDLLVGLWTDTAGNTHGYLLRPSDGEFTPFDYPNSIHTEAWGINASHEAVGLYLDQSSNYHGFVLSRGHFSSIDYPGAAGTLAFGINPQGDAVGMFFDSAGNTHGFVVNRSPRLR